MIGYYSQVPPGKLRLVLDALDILAEHDLEERVAWKGAPQDRESFLRAKRGQRLIRHRNEFGLAEDCDTAAALAHRLDPGAVDWAGRVQRAERLIWERNLRPACGECDHGWIEVEVGVRGVTRCPRCG